MLPNIPISKLPLPKNWSRRVRSALVHTIALAQMSLTHTRSVAANSISAPIRLNVENERLRNEIPLLD